MIKGLLVIALLITLPASQVAPKQRLGRIEFVGTVQLIAPDFGVSGDLAVYRLAKYKVERVCKGEYNEKEIVVDHLIVTGQELADIKIGDRVFVSVEKSKKTLARFNADGIRSPKEKVKIFFVGGKVTRNSESPECPY